MDLMIRFDAYHSRFFGSPDSLRIFTDGTIVYQSTAAEGPLRQNRAGTFQYQLNSEERSEAQALLQLLLSTSAKIPKQRGSSQFEVTAFQDGKTKTYPLFSDDALPEGLILAQERFSQWQSKAESAPLSVVSLIGRLDRGTAHDNLVFTFANTGRSPVTFLVDGSSFRLIRSKTGSEETLWSVSERPRVGLMSGKGALLDGLTIPATIEPDEHASLVFHIPMGTLPRGQAGGVNTAGTIILTMPEEPSAVFPETPFALTSQVNQGS